MYAVIETGSKQYTIRKGAVLKIEKLDLDKDGAFSFDKVLLVSENGKTEIGAPYLPGSVVKATVLDQIRDKKILIFKKRRRQNYRRCNGHRQSLTVVRIDDIVLKAK
jgi:large subunit ribosomal protein L21